MCAPLRAAKTTVRMGDPPRDIEASRINTRRGAIVEEPELAGGPGDPARAAFVLPESLDVLNTGRAQLLQPIPRVAIETFDASQVHRWLENVFSGQPEIAAAAKKKDINGAQLKTLVNTDGLAAIGVTGAPGSMPQLMAKKKILAALSRRQGTALWKGVRTTMLDRNARKWLTKVYKDESSGDTESEEARYKEQWDIADVFMKLNNIIHPQGALRKKWDFLQIALLIYLALLVPFRIGFDQDTNPWEFFFILDMFVDVYFIVDIYLSFKTAYVTDDGDLQYSPGMIAKHYVHTWFIIDVLGCLPVNYISFLPGMDPNDQSMKGNRVFKLLRLARLLKLLRLARVNRLLQRYEEELYELKSSLKISKIFILMGFIGHWMSSAWYFFGALEVDAVTADGDIVVGWVGQHYGGLAENTTYGSRYMTAMYFSFMTMTTVGYGDISASTVPEMLFCVLAMIIGGLTFGFIVGVLSDINQQNDLADKYKGKRVGRVLAFMRGNHMKPALVHKVRNYYTRMFSERTAIDAVWILDLPENLRDDVARCVKMPHTHHHCHHTHTPPPHTHTTTTHTHTSMCVNRRGERMLTDVSRFHRDDGVAQAAQVHQGPDRERELHPVQRAVLLR